MIRRFGEPPRSDLRYTRRAGAYALLPRGGHLLLTNQQNPGPDIQLPGGGIDPGESPLVALHREVFEETGWRIAAPDGGWVVEPFTQGERLIVATLDHAKVRQERHNSNPAGHYARPDVTRLTLNHARQRAL